MVEIVGRPRKATIAALGAVYDAENILLKG